MGFEPTVSFNTIVFKTNALNRSTTYPEKQKKGLEPSSLILARLHSTIELHLQYYRTTQGSLKDLSKKKSSLCDVVLVVIVIFKGGKFLKN